MRYAVYTTTRAYDYYDSTNTNYGTHSTCAPIATDEKCSATPP